MAVPAPLPRYKNLAYPFSGEVWLSLLGSIVATTLAVSLGELHRSGVSLGRNLRHALLGIGSSYLV